MFNDLLTSDGKAIIADRYLTKGETAEGMVERMVGACEKEHGERMRKYLNLMWFLPATPILSNLGTERGLPISCYLNNVDDSLKDISDTWTENIGLGSKGGGIGTCWSDLRAAGSPVAGKGETSGIMPFIKVMDSITCAVSQGSLRRGASAAYLDVSHPEITEFVEMRKPSGDFNRKSFNIHHGVVISDEFMFSAERNLEFPLIDPADNEVKKKMSARVLLQQILETRMETGEPYLLFIDSVNDNLPQHHKALGLKVRQSNLCSEIVLPTGRDHLGNLRTAVCCLGSLNLEYYDAWKDEEQFVEDCLRFLDIVLSTFIEKAKDIDGFKNAVYSASRERSVGLGVMGLHSYFQSKNVPFGCAMAKSINTAIFKNIRRKASDANYFLGKELGSNPDFRDWKEDTLSNEEKEQQHRRFSYCLAVAPTANISILAGDCSPSIEPWSANAFIRKTLTGNFEVRNKYLKKLLKELGKDDETTWASIMAHHGSVQGLEFLSDDQKQVFKTAFEIDQHWIIELAADRTPLIDQAQSLNLFFDADVDKAVLLSVHFAAWRKKVKSLYYVRSKSLQRPSYATDSMHPVVSPKLIGTVKEEECFACQ